MYNKFSTIQRRLDAVMFLRALKKVFTYRQLSELTGIPAPILSNYINGKTVPSIEKADHIISILTSSHVINKFLQVSLRRRALKYAMLRDPGALILIATYISHTCMGEVVHKVATITPNGLPLATHVSYVLERPLLYINGPKGLSRVTRVVHMINKMHGIKARRAAFYNHFAINPNDRILVVDENLSNLHSYIVLYKVIRSLNARVSKMVFIYENKPGNYKKFLNMIGKVDPSKVIVLIKES